MDSIEHRKNETFIFYILGLFNIKSFPVVPSIILRVKKERTSIRVMKQTGIAKRLA